MAKCKKYEDGGEVDGGLTFAEMSDEDREAQAKARMAEMGGDMPEEPKVKRVTPKAKPAAVKAQPAKTSTSATPTATSAKTDAAKYSEAKAGSGGPSREIKPAKKGAVRDLVDIFNRAPKLMKSGGKVGGASKRADGIAQRGKTKGRVI